MNFRNVLKKTVLVATTCIAFNLGLVQGALAAEDAAVAQTPPSTESDSKNINQNDQTRIDHLATLSGKTKEEISKMRTEQNMGWGEIAKALGVPPGELGHAIRDERHERNAKRKLEKKERKEQRSAMKEKRRDERKSDQKVEKK